MHVRTVSSVARRHSQSLGAEVIVGYELPEVCAWNQTWVFAKSSISELPVQAAGLAFIYCSCNPTAK